MRRHGKTFFTLLLLAALLNGCLLPENPPGRTIVYPPNTPANLPTPPPTVYPTYYPTIAPSIHSTSTPTPFATVLPSIAAATQQPSPTADAGAISGFLNWSKNRGISIVGINESTDHFYYNRSKPSDFLDAASVPNLLEVADGLYKLPDELFRAMNGKSFYVSHRRGRGYTILGSWPEQGILGGMNRGSIIEQPLSARQTVHEFAHILDYHGIRGVYGDSQNHWKQLDAERTRIFNVSFTYDPNLRTPPEGYIDVYSTANDAENFAQHFVAFVLDAGEFRNRARNETLLQQKYDFMKKLFGREY